MPRKKKEAPNRKDGLYEVKITTGKTPEGKLERKSFYSSISKGDAKRQAEEWKVQQAASAMAGEPVIDKEVRFDTWARKWLESYKLGTVRPHTYNFTYRSNVEKYLIPYFGKLSICNVKGIHIQRYFNQHSWLAESTLNKHRIILRDMFDKAIDNDIALKNPAKNISLPKTYWEEKRRRSYNLEQYRLALKYAMEHPGGMGTVLMLCTGIRRSELIGLKWGDIDFRSQTVHIQRGVVPTTGEIIEADVKSKSSNRIIPFDSGLKKYLESITRCGEYVMPSRSPNSFAKSQKQFMEKLSSDVGIDALTPHELRHTYGTVLRERGVDIYTIQKVMGHSDINVTAGIYVHNDINVLKKQLKISDKKRYKCRSSVVNLKISTLKAKRKIKKKSPITA